MKISRQAYADMYGPTVGDRVRLGDTELWIEVEEDHTHYGDEVKFGGGKVIRDGMGQSQRCDDAVMDTVITNALILDWWGIVKADVGIQKGRIAAIGKAGNPDTQPDVTIVIGPGTEIIAGEGKILTAGGIDAHIHFICPQQVEEALMSGITTMLGGGTGPATGTNATTCTPGPWHIGKMLQAVDSLPMNIGFLGKGNASLPAALEEQVMAGAAALKIHEDWGAMPPHAFTAVTMLPAEAGHLSANVEYTYEMKVASPYMTYDILGPDASTPHVFEPNQTIHLHTLQMDGDREANGQQSIWTTDWGEPRADNGDFLTDYFILATVDLDSYPDVSTSVESATWGRIKNHLSR